MWEDKPWLGWGPGTYMFKYAPYQLSYQLTIISTNFGTNGNAHSEYLGPLAEQGIVGLLIVVSFVLFYIAGLPAGVFNNGTWGQRYFVYRFFWAWWLILCMVFSIIFWTPISFRFPSGLFWRRWCAWIFLSETGKTKTKIAGSAWTLRIQ